MGKYTPLPHEYMLISIIGFLLSVFYVFGVSPSWGFAFATLCAILFIASVVNMSTAGLEEQDLVELAIHEQAVRAGKHRKTRS